MNMMAEFFAVHEQLITGVGMFLTIPVLIFGLLMFCVFLSVIKNVVRRMKFSRFFLHLVLWVAIYFSVFSADYKRFLWLVVAFSIFDYLKKSADKKENKEATDANRRVSDIRENEE